MQKLPTLLSLIVIASLPFFQLSAQPEINGTVKVDRNVVFGMYSGLALLMDVYYPENPNGYGVIHVSGSGWTKPLSLDAQMLSHQGHVKLEAEGLVEGGYTVFSVNHRAVPRFIYPAAVEDVQRAVRFIRFNATKYGINADRIGAIGGSSGGHLVSMLGTLDGNETLEDESPINKVSAKVQCVIARAAPTNFMICCGESFLGVKNEINNPLSLEHKLVQKASPINYVTSEDPPFLLVHGDKDESVPFVLSEQMHEKLREMGIPTRLIKMEGSGHGPSFPGAVNPPDLKKEYVLWMDEYLIGK